jgi:site-specific DNA-methyltransferase (cytosine-N4-specific)
MGSGTTAQVAQDLGRKYLGCELNPEYGKLQQKRLAQQSLELI